MSLDEVRDFFFDDGLDYHSWRPGHTFSQSPCAPIIKIKRTPWCLWYSCELHKKIEHDSLVTLEHHMKYAEPEVHKKVITEKLRAREIDKGMIIEAKIDEMFGKKSNEMRAKKHYSESFEERIKFINSTQKT